MPAPKAHKESGGKASKSRLEELRLELGTLQRRALERRVPAVIILEGIDAWGMAKHTNQIARGLDPRGFDLHSASKPRPEDKERPFISRFFEMMPARGRIAIFDRSWYFWVVRECHRHGDKRLERHLNDVRMLERHHAQEGWVILKFYFDLKKKELKRRFREQDPKDPCRRDYLLDGEASIEDYDEMVALWKDVLRGTEAPYAPWTWVWKEDEDEAIIDVLTAIKQRMEQALASSASYPMTLPEPRRNEDERARACLRGIDKGQRVPLGLYKEALPKLQARLARLQCEMYKASIPTIIVFEGWDAAGKGGNILRLTAPLNPRGYRVTPVSAPSEEEKAHHHLWRFHRHMPADGHIAIFDRSWYGRVLVERVEGLVPDREWRMAYDEINEMEQALVAHGANLLKFWLQIDKEEQMRRFGRREEDPDKRWKITAEDYRNRDKWDLYVPAVEEMIARTDTGRAPWTIVPSNDKRFARLFVLQRVIESMELSLEGECTIWPEWFSEVQDDGRVPDAGTMAD